MSSADRSAAVERLYMETIRALAAMVEAKDPSFSYAHLERLPSLSAQLAKRLALPDHYVKAVEVAAYLHDIGKTVIPETILAKKGSLSPQRAPNHQSTPGSGLGHY